MMAPLQPEKIGDIDEGFVPEPTQVDEMGLTPEERQAFDDMKDADKTIPEGPEEAPEPAEGTTPPEGQTVPVDALPAPGAVKKPPPEPPEEDDEPDQVTRDPRTGKEQRTISYGKHQRLLKKERDAAEALRLQNEETRVNQAKLAERLAILNDALTVPPAPQQLTPEQQEYARQQEVQQNPMLEETIDPAVDLAAAIFQMQRRQIYMANASMLQQESTQEALQEQRMVQDFTRDAEMFSRTEEGQHFFGQEGAYQYLKNSRLREIGFELFDKDAADPNERFTQAEINQMVSDYNGEEKSLVNNALQQRRSPAKQILRHAMGRGWKPPQAAGAAAPPAPSMTAAPTSAPARNTLARPPAAPPAQAQAAAAAPAARSAVAQIQAEQAGAQASRSLSDGGGVPPGEPLSPEQLLKMDDEEFGIYIDNLPTQRLQALMGREFPGRG
jgi:hypothetical protein